MSKIWLDVTTLLRWNRPAVGIIRVESEFASYLLETKIKGVYFCKYGANGYEIVSRRDVRWINI